MTRMRCLSSGISAPGEEVIKAKKRSARSQGLAMKIQGANDMTALPPKAGIFFVAHGNLWMTGISWAESASHAGFRAYEVDHPHIGSICKCG